MAKDFSDKIVESIFALVWPILAWMALFILLAFSTIGGNSFVTVTGEKQFGTAMVQILLNGSALVLMMYILLTAIITQARIWKEEIVALPKNLEKVISGAAAGIRESTKTDFNPPQ